MPGKENQQKDGVLKSVEQICEETWESVYKFIYYKVQTREEAEDITQETYLTLCTRKCGRFFYPSFFLSLPSAIRRNTWYNNKTLT